MSPLPGMSRPYASVSLRGRGSPPGPRAPPVPRPPSTMSASGRLRWRPRNCGIAQKVQPMSQAFGDFHVRVGDAAGQKARVVASLEVSRGRRARPVVPAGRLTDQLDDAREVRGAEDPIDLGHLLQDVAAVTLGETARDDEGAAGPLLFSFASSRIVSIDSSRARSMKAQVLTTRHSASSGPLHKRESGLGQHAESSARSRPWFFGQPRVRQMDLHRREPVYLAWWGQIADGRKAHPASHARLRRKTWVARSPATYVAHSYPKARISISFKRCSPEPSKTGRMARCSSSIRAARRY